MSEGSEKLVPRLVEKVLDVMEALGHVGRLRLAGRPVLVETRRLCGSRNPVYRTTGSPSSYQIQGAVRNRLAHKAHVGPSGGSGRGTPDRQKCAIVTSVPVR